MFWKVLNYVVAVLRLILEAEEKLGAGAGPAKRAFVLERTAGELAAVRGAMAPADCTVEVVVDHVGALVDHTVSLLNCLGVFSRGAAPQAPATSPAPAEPPPEG